MNIHELKESIEFQFNWVRDGLDADDYVILANHIKKHAQPWLQATANIPNILYRGVRHSPDNVYAFREPVRTDRKPKDSTELAHNILNTMIGVMGGVANRSNAISCSYEKGNTFEYGEVFAVIPLGEFHYTWSPVMEDWYYDVASTMRFSYFLKDSANPVSEMLARLYNEKVRELTRHIQILKDRDAQDIPDTNLDFYTVEDLEQELDRLLSPKGRQTFYQEKSHYAVQEVGADLWEQLLLNPNNYNREKVAEFIQVDKGLFEASLTKHEIMIHCDKVLYIHPVMWPAIRQLINGQTDTESSGFIRHLVGMRQYLQAYYNGQPKPIIEEQPEVIDENKIRNAALAGIATASLAGAFTSPSKMVRNTDLVDMPPGVSQHLAYTLPPLPEIEDQQEEPPAQEVEEPTPEVTEEMQLRFLATKIARKFRINPELSYKIVELAHKHEDEAFPKAIDILAVIAVESSFNPRAISKLKTDPAVGLMQVRPGIWGIDPAALNNIENQIKVGVRILKRYHERVGYEEGAFQAYNIGITSYRRGNTNPRYLAKVEAAKEFLIAALMN